MHVPHWHNAKSARHANGSRFSKAQYVNAKQYLRTHKDTMSNQDATYDAETIVKDYEEHEKPKKKNYKEKY